MARETTAAPANRPAKIRGVDVAAPACCDALADAMLRLAAAATEVRPSVPRSSALAPDLTGGVFEVLSFFFAALLSAFGAPSSLAAADLVSALSSFLAAVAGAAAAPN